MEKNCRCRSNGAVEAIKQNQNCAPQSRTIGCREQSPTPVLHQSTSGGNLSSSSNPRQARRRLFAKARHGLAGRWISAATSSSGHEPGHDGGLAGWRLFAVNRDHFVKTKLRAIVCIYESRVVMIHRNLLYRNSVLNYE